ncbi:MAG: hypothetical protein JWL95_2315 [Gemmatimonadetes bacterium]|nr:hypothetical protein [Gemmatimonadota bacterium]
MVYLGVATIGGDSSLEGASLPLSMITPRSSRRWATFTLVLAGACSREPSSESASVHRAASAPATNASSVAAIPVAAAVVAQQGDTGRPQRVAPKVPLLTDAEQRVADGIVFAPCTATRFLVAARNKRLLLDLGRVDVELKQDAELLAMVRRVSARTGPLARATRVSVRGTWGDETDSIVGYDVWNGRVVAVLGVSTRTDSLLRRNAPLVGVASIAEGASGPLTSAPASPPFSAVAAAASSSAPACVRDSLAPSMQTRVAVVRDSLVRWVTDSLRPPFPRLEKSTVVRGDATTGCFASWRAVVIVTSRTPSLEWNEERALLVGADGRVQPARLRDLRLRAHESLMSFDADADGIDELAARGLATRMGAQSVLKLDPAARRFTRYASGFAWESR